VLFELAQSLEFRELEGSRYRCRRSVKEMIRTKPSFFRWQGKAF